MAEATKKKKLLIVEDDPPAMNILIADDNPTNLKLLRVTLEAEGHKVICAHDGLEALELLEREAVDGIVSDILMPRMDGYRFCLEVRRHGKHHALPFIVYTNTYLSPSDEKTAMDLGANKFLKKPAPAAEIIDALRKAAAEPPHKLVLPPAGQELDLMKEYSERLVEKLEQKNAELEARTLSLQASEEQIRKSREHLRALAARLQAAREEERIRISREMHDGLGEMLAGIKMGLTWMRTMLESPNRRLERKQLLEQIGKIDAMAGETAGRVRKLCTELRPSVLDDLGLAAALGWQAREFQARTHIRCDAKMEAPNLVAGRDQATAIFRIFQEILTNVARHAAASKVQVRLQTRGFDLFLEVKDNGKGIRPEDMAGNKSLGLLGMQERAGLIGGSVEVSGRPGKGTRILVRIPLGKPEKITKLEQIDTQS
jgi:signal transduction histidine kinase